MSIQIEVKKVNDKTYIFFNGEVVGEPNLVEPLNELKTLETLINALPIFENTKIYDVIIRGIQIRLARMIAKYAYLSSGEGNA